MGAYEEYLAATPEPARSRIAGYLERARALAPGAEEGTGYGMPALRYRGKALLSVVTTRTGYSAYPFSAEVIAVVVPGFPDLEATKGGIRFTEAAPLPDAALDALVTARRSEIDAALDRRR